MVSIFIFRRDLRLYDNTALLAALASGEKVLPCFIFDDRQLSKKNDYRGDHLLQFMQESLEDLKNQLKQVGGKLYLFSGVAEEVIGKLIEEVDVSSVYVNRDYTPFSQKRDEAIETICKGKNVYFHSYDDLLLQPPEKVLKADGKPYTVYTPYMKNSITHLVGKPKDNTYTNYFTASISFETPEMLTKLLEHKNDQQFIEGGRSVALKVLKDIKRYEHYHQERDFPAIDGTTGLSAHNKFGTISCREFYWAVAHAFGKEHTLIRELYWRDFYTQVAYHFPKVFGHAFQKQYEQLSWSHDKELFEAWCEGKTGYPIVDAGMRQLNATGYMHNRVRMIVASFLTKDLLIDWQWGEKYFAKQLIDYDPCVNNGSWQWAASTGTDAQPYFRIFNPWLQQKKFDPDAKYIKEWIPELRDLEPKEIHGLEKFKSSTVEYPDQIIDHYEMRDKALALFKSI